MLAGAWRPLDPLDNPLATDNLAAASPTAGSGPQRRHGHRRVRKPRMAHALTKGLPDGPTVTDGDAALRPQPKLVASATLTVRFRNARDLAQCDQRVTFDNSAERGALHARRVRSGKSVTLAGVMRLMPQIGTIGGQRSASAARTCIALDSPA